MFMRKIFTFYQTTLRHKPEDNILPVRRNFLCVLFIGSVVILMLSRDLRSVTKNHISKKLASI